MGGLQCLPVILLSMQYFGVHGFIVGALNLMHTKLIGTITLKYRQLFLAKVVGLTFWEQTILRYNGNILIIKRCLLGDHIKWMDSKLMIQSINKYKLCYISFQYPCT